MQNTLDLKALEKRAFKSYHQDGILDMYLGFLMVIIPLAGIMTDLGLSETVSLGFHLITTVLAVGVFIVLKKKVTVPRLGHVAFGPERTMKQRRLRMVLGLSFAIGVALFAAVGAARGGEGLLAAFVTDKTAMGLFAFANFVAVFSLIGYYLDFQRAYAMGVLFGGGFAAALVIGTPVYIMLAGLVFTVVGIVQFVRFLKDNPRPVFDTGLE